MRRRMKLEVTLTSRKRLKRKFMDGVRENKLSLAVTDGLGVAGEMTRECGRENAGSEPNRK